MPTDLSTLTPEDPGSNNIPFSKGSSWGATTAALLLASHESGDVDWTSVGAGGGAPAFQGTWENYGSGFQALRFCKRRGVVFIEGLVKNGSFGTVIFTLPAGSRPTDNIVMCPTFAYESSTFQTARYDLEPDGDVKAVVPLSGTAQYLALQCSFYAG